MQGREGVPTRTSIKRHKMGGGAGQTAVTGSYVDGPPPRPAVREAAARSRCAVQGCGARPVQAQQPRPPTREPGRGPSHFFPLPMGAFFTPPLAPLGPPFFFAAFAASRAAASLAACGKRGASSSSRGREREGRVSGGREGGPASRAFGKQVRAGCGRRGLESQRSKQEGGFQSAAVTEKGIRRAAPARPASPPLRLQACT
jgi:hypothetical protein